MASKRSPRIAADDTGRSGAKAAAAAAAIASVITVGPANGPLAATVAAQQVPAPGRGNGKKLLPAVNAAISYQRWRAKYVREYRGGLFVAYNGKHLEEPANAVTVSEVRIRRNALPVWHLNRQSLFTRLVSSMILADASLSCQSICNGPKIISAA